MPYKLPSIFYVLLFIVLLIANISVYKTIFSPHTLSVSVLDVGKGRAVLVKTPENETVLIDTGPDASILRALGESLLVWQRDIDVVILTSPSAGYAGGLPVVQSRYRVSEIIHVGDKSIPYGSSLILGNSIIKILAPATLQISFGTSVFNISSSTPIGVYTPDGLISIKKVKGPRVNARPRDGGSPDSIGKIVFTNFEPPRELSEKLSVP